MILRDALPPHPEEDAKQPSRRMGGRAPQDEGSIIRRAMCLGVIAAFCTLAAPATADELVSGLSTDLIKITSSFTGTDIVLFGAIETTDAFASPEGHDIVVVIRGPDVNVTVRRKERIAGIWLNAEQIRFDGLPGYYFLASTRPLAAIAPPETLQRFRLGAANLQAAVEPGTDPALADAFRAAAVRAKMKAGLYLEGANAIEFLSRSLFRARIPVPASVPPGQYRAEVYLFRNGNVVSAQSTPLFIDKTGLERQLYNFAQRDSLAYGFAAVFMALIFGWVSYLVFRRN